MALLIGSDEVVYVANLFTLQQISNERPDISWVWNYIIPKVSQSKMYLYKYKLLKHPTISILYAIYIYIYIYIYTN